MTPYRILFGSLAAFHVIGLFLNSSHVRKTIPRRWKAYVPGWTMAAVASLIVFTMPDGPLSAFWLAYLEPASEHAPAILLGTYVLSLIVCLALVFFRDPRTQAAPRSFIAFTLRLLIGLGSDQDTGALITCGEYAIVGTCGSALLLPALVANGWFSASQVAQNVVAASVAASVGAMILLRAIRRVAGEP